AGRDGPLPAAQRARGDDRRDRRVRACVRPGRRAVIGTAQDTGTRDTWLLAEGAPVGYLTTTPDGLVQEVGSTLLAWTGYRREDLVGRRRLVDLLSVGGRIYHETHFAPMLRMQGT